MEPEPARPRRPRPRPGAGLSSILLLNTMIGSGFLSMAFCVQTAGWPLFVGALAVTCFTTYLTSVMLLETGRAVGLDTGDMSEVVEKAWACVATGERRLQRADLSGAIMSCSTRSGL